MNKREIIGIFAIAGICTAIILFGLFFGKKTVKLVDASGEVFASIEKKGETIHYVCEEDEMAYVSMIWEEACQIVMEQEGYQREQAEEWLFRKQAECYTFYDREIQGKLVQAYEKHQMEMNGNFAASVNDIHGKVLACYSVGRDQADANYVLASTYAGSTMKPLSVYGPAMEAGILHWSSMLPDEPYTVVSDKEGNLIDWPQNTVPYTYEDYMVADALQKSLNTVAVQALKEYGVRNAVQFMAENYQIDVSEEEEIIAKEGEDEVLGNLALGYLRSGVTVKNMAGYYQVFANGGTYTPAHGIQRMEIKGTCYYQHSEEARQVFSPETAYICNRMLKRVVEEGGTAPSAAIPQVDICGKTGTSDDYADNWFIGCSPQYVCAVWHGSREGAYEPDHKGSVLVFHDFMEQMHQEGLEFEQPEGVVKVSICEKTGCLAGTQCESITYGYYSSEHQPVQCTEEETR